MEMKVFPHNLEAEQNILSNILFDGNLIGDTIGILKPKDFYDPRHQVIYEAMVKMYQDNINIDSVTLTEYAKTKLQDIGGIAYVAELFKNCLQGSIKNHINIVKELSKRREIASIGFSMYKAAIDDDHSSREIINAAEDKIFSLSDIKSKEMVSISDALLSTMKLIEKNYLNGGGITGIPTGFKELDNRINGLNRGDFIIIAARPSMGKTALALNIASNVSRDKNVALFSLEMVKEKLIQRVLSSETMIRHENIVQGKLRDEDFIKLSKAAGNIASRKLMIDDNAAISVSEIKSKCKKMKLQSGLDVVLIDYIGIIEGDEKTENRTQELSKMSRQLKNMAKELNIAVIVLSQLNRAPEARKDKRPQLSDLRESGGIEQDADVVILLYRDDYYNADSDKKGITECIIAKNRDGAVGVIELGWLGEFQRFADVWKGDE